MQPRPISETTGPVRPRARVFINPNIISPDSLDGKKPLPVFSSASDGVRQSELGEVSTGGRSWQAVATGIGTLGRIQHLPICDEWFVITYSENMARKQVPAEKRLGIFRRHSPT